MRMSGFMRKCIGLFLVLLSIQNQTVDLFHVHEHTSDHEHHADLGFGEICDAELHHLCPICHYLPLRYFIPDNSKSWVFSPIFIEHNFFIPDRKVSTNSLNQRVRGPPLS